MEEKEQFALAVELNSRHGDQLSTEDKIEDAIMLYSYGYTYESIRDKLSVSLGTVSAWLRAP